MLKDTFKKGLTKKRVMVEIMAPAGSYESLMAAINAGAKDCSNLKDNFEIITEKEDFYKVKTELEKKIDTFTYSAVEWRPLNYIDLNREQSDKILEILSNLEELDDVQNIFTNANLEKINI